MHRYLGIKPQASIHHHLATATSPQHSLRLGCRSQTLVRLDLCDLLGFLTLQLLPDHGGSLFLHPSSPHQRPCPLAHIRMLTLVFSLRSFTIHVLS